MLLPDVTVELITAKGPVYIEGPVQGPDMAGLVMNGKLTVFRPPEEQKKALIEISGLVNGLVYLARHENEIVGYITFHRPDESARWYRHPRLIEMGGVEISPDWRQCRLGENLIKAAFSNKALDYFIVLSMNYWRYWDLENCKLDTWEYQRMLTGYLSKAGFEKANTNDPEIIGHPANFLMAIGTHVSKQDIVIFTSLLFQ